MKWLRRLFDPEFRRKDDEEANNRWWNYRSKERLRAHLVGVPKEYLPIPGNQRPRTFASQLEAPKNFTCTAEISPAGQVWGGWIDDAFEPDVRAAVLKELGY